MNIISTAGPLGPGLRFSGRIDAVESHRLDDALQAHFSSSSNLLVDLRDVDYLDSSGLASLVRAWRTATSTGNQFRLLLPSNHDARRIFTLTGFDTVFDLVDPEAIDSDSSTSA